MKPKTNLFKYSLLGTICLLSLSQTALAGLAVSPGVTTDILDNIDKVQDEELRELLKTAVWPGFGERHMNLDRPDEQLSEFERRYKEHPLTWNQKIENVRYILEQKDDPSELTTENVEYKDIVFGESVIPIADRRVVEISKTFYLENELERLEAERQAAIAALYESGAENLGLELQKIEDEYAIKLRTLMAAESAYKDAKVAYLKLDNQRKYGRITDEEYQAATRQVVADFEAFFEIGSDVPLFDENKIRQIASSIYDDSIVIVTSEGTEQAYEAEKGMSPQYLYWILSSILMLVALVLAYLGFKRLRKK